MEIRPDMEKLHERSLVVIADISLALAEYELAKCEPIVIPTGARRLAMLAEVDETVLATPKQWKRAKKRLSK